MTESTINYIVTRKIPIGESYYDEEVHEDIVVRAPRPNFIGCLIIKHESSYVVKDGKVTEPAEHKTRKYWSM